MFESGRHKRNKALDVWAFYFGEQIVYCWQVQIGWWQVRSWTVDRLMTSKHLMLFWHFTSWWTEVAGGLITITYCARLLPHTPGNYLWTGGEGRLPDMTLCEVCLLPFTCCYAGEVLVQPRGTSSAIKTWKWFLVSSSERSVFWGLSVTRSLPDGGKYTKHCACLNHQAN